MRPLRQKLLNLLGFLALMITASSANAQLVAGFKATPIEGCSPMIVRFTDTSSGNPTSWRWDYQIGSSTLQNPIATFFNPGTYTVKLVVRNASGADSVVKSQYIRVNATPTPKFGVSDTTGCYPLRVQFSDSSLAGEGSIVRWQWDFGDGTIDSTQNPVHIYRNPGLFTVNLRITNSKGCVLNLTKPQLIKTVNGVNANFTWTSAASCAAPATVNFNNTTTGNGTMTYQWNFGNGNTSVLQNPSTNYLTTGSYTVQLIVTNNFGCVDTMTKPNAINIGFVRPDFTKPDSVCVNVPFSITNTSVPATASSSWSFGDGNTSTVINPTHRYTTPGTFTIKLVNNFGTCLDSISKTIVVNPAPAPAFTAGVRTSCSAPFTVNFTNQTVGTGLSYQWNFGDGNSSTTQNPSHTYTATGSYTVTLVVTNASGCKDSLVRNNFVSIVPPKINSIANVPYRGCAPYTLNTSANITSNDPVVSYAWNFGDGATSTAANPSHTYSVAGTYTIKLKITTQNGCVDSMTVPNAITIGNRPRSMFSATPLINCAWEPIAFTDTSFIAAPDSIDQWFWEFGDGGTSTLQNPQHQYIDTGWMDVQLVVWSNGCADTLKKIKYLYIKPPIAIFNIERSCTNKFNITFRDRSIGALTYDWSFGDGTSSTAQNPMHTYATTGTYTVRLRVTNGACYYIATQTLKIIDERAAFVLQDSVLCRNATVTFLTPTIDSSNIASYVWHFGDGQTGTGRTVTHNYTSTGSFTPKLIITDLNGCVDSATLNLPIAVHGPSAAFTSGLSCLNSPVDFIDNSTASAQYPIRKWIMSYGDGTTDTLTALPIRHTYTTRGEYLVLMTVVDSVGCSDRTNISVTVTKPISNFLVSDTSQCRSTPFVFTDQSQLASSLKWLFGDGASATGGQVTHTYVTPGSYTVTHIAIDANGCTDTTRRPNLVNAYNTLAAFTLSDSFSTCPPLILDMSNNSANFISHTWDFGDASTSTLLNPTHTYTFPGEYDVVLRVTGNGGCTDSMVRKVTILGPRGRFVYNPLRVCEPGRIDFTAITQNTVGYVWDYNDGNTEITSDSVRVHYYPNRGAYLPRIILKDAFGCQVPILGADSIRVFGVDATMNRSIVNICDSGVVNFTNTVNTNDQIVGYRWDFGDGNTSTVSNPSHNYNVNGVYNVRLIVTTRQGCRDTVNNEVPVKVYRTPNGRILGDLAKCMPASFQFAGELTSPDTSAITWRWDFGNSKTDSVQNPLAQLYPNAGDYTVKLNVSNEVGCNRTSTQVVTVHPLPNIDAGAGTIVCNGSGIPLNATGGNSYSWSADPTLSCLNCANPVASPTVPTRYYVTGASAFGCLNRDSVDVRVQYKLTMNVGPGDTLCKGESFNLSAGGTHLYQWSPSLYLNNNSIKNPRTKPDSTITYMVVGRDSSNCFRDTGFVRMIVYPMPTFDIVQDKIDLNVGRSIQLNSTNSPDINKWQWTPAKDLSCTDCPNPVSAPKQSITYTCTATNGGGCVARDFVTINVVCNDGNIFIPNTFSPNGDGTNDVFYPRGKGVYGIRTLRIFNRWGEMVFQKSNFNPNDVSAGWDGTYKGAALTPDVYVWTVDVVCDNSYVLSFKGNVTLIK
jgi:gliding motility-associated-like protein